MWNYLISPPSKTPLSTDFSHMLLSQFFSQTLQSLLSLFTGLLFLDQEFWRLSFSVSNLFYPRVFSYQISLNSDLLGVPVSYIQSLLRCLNLTHIRDHHAPKHCLSSWVTLPALHYISAAQGNVLMNRNENHSGVPKVEVTLRVAITVFGLIRNGVI